MTRLRPQDLSAEARTRLERQIGEKLGPAHRKKDRSEATEPGLPVICGTCRTPADGEAAQARHLSETGHVRYECVLTKEGL